MSLGEVADSVKLCSSLQAKTSFGDKNRQITSSEVGRPHNDASICVGRKGYAMIASSFETCQPTQN